MSTAKFHSLHVNESGILQRSESDSEILEVGVGKFRKTGVGVRYFISDSAILFISDSAILLLTRDLKVRLL